ncbi:MAG: NUDIX domain-containing protein [Desulfobacterales bacterium]|nr:MAG: NUDIX domain-containing protein [Desulfobacterales bacterium]
MRSSPRIRDDPEDILFILEHCAFASFLTAEKQMILSAGTVIVRKDHGEWKYLFLRAYRNWDFPKGIVEPPETPLETAKREVQEETGIRALSFRWGEIFKETLPYNRGTKIARYYIAETSDSAVTLAINPEIGKPEHHEYRWISGEEIERLAPARLRPIIQWADDLIARDRRSNGLG